MSERVVVSPGSGIFTPEDSLAAPGTGLLPGTAGTADGAVRWPRSTPVGVGDLVGRVGVAEVRTPFAGQVVRWLATAGRTGPRGPAAGLAAGPRGRPVSGEDDAARRPGWCW